MISVVADLVVPLMNMDQAVPVGRPFSMKATIGGVYMTQTSLFRIGETEKVLFTTSPYQISS
jgi:hypothetical protein